MEQTEQLNNVAMQSPIPRRRSSLPLLLSSGAALMLAISSSSSSSPRTAEALLPVVFPPHAGRCRQPPRRSRGETSDVVVVYSSVGGGGVDSGGNGGNKNGRGGGRNSKGEWDDFLNPEREESENLVKAREYMSETALPISYEHKNDELAEKEETDAQLANNKNSSSSSSALATRYPNDFTGGLSPDILARNPYMQVVSKLSPSELISKFTSTAHPRVQNAVRSTILGLIGGLPKMAFDTSTITTGQKLASLMFQLQMTGYMFKNAEYRLSVQQSLGVGEGSISHSNKLLLTGSEAVANDDNRKIDPLNGKVKGKLRIRYGGKNKKQDDDIDPADDETALPGGMEMEVDAAAYMSELRSEVSKLREELMTTQKEKDDALRKDLLMYIRTLPQQELQGLTDTMSQDVLVAMKGLVNAVISGIGEGQIGPDTVTEQSGEAMAQLCMWQLVIGYNLRTLEVREEMLKSLKAGDDKDDDVNGVYLDSPGALE